MFFRRAAPFILAAACFAFAVPAAHATKPNPEHKVTICHATSSVKNPYVRITVDVATLFGPKGHLHHVHDIIPPFSYNGKQYPGLNWLGGEVTWDNGCHIAEETTTTAAATTTTQPQCVEDECVTTTTEPVTTTTEPQTTTTLGETTTTAAPTTTQPTTTTEGTQSLGRPTTTVALAVPVHSAVPPTPAEPQTLAFTGTSAFPLTVLGLAFLIAGLLLSRRRRII